MNSGRTPRVKQTAIQKQRQNQARKVTCGRSLRKCAPIPAPAAAPQLDGPVGPPVSPVQAACVAVGGAGATQQGPVGPPVTPELPAPAVEERALPDASDEERGGCDAMTFVSLGIWETKEEAIAALDRHIEPAFAALQRHRPDVPREEAGSEGKWWSDMAVQRAVTAAGWHWKRFPEVRSVQLRDADLLRELKTAGSFLVEGRLNSSFVRGTKTLRNNFLGLGIHSAAVVGKHVFDQAFHPGQALSLSTLHINPGTGLVDKDKGFFKEIRKVYRTWECEFPGECSPTGGQCHKLSAQ